MKKNFFWQMLRFGPAEQEEIEHRHRVEEIIDFLEIQHIRRTPVGRLPYGLQKRVELAARWPWSRSCCCWMNRWLA
jgi:branched-chain amino acid transport system ATP-binding protein